MSSEVTSNFHSCKNIDEMRIGQLTFTKLINIEVRYSKMYKIDENNGHNYIKYVECKQERCNRKCEQQNE